VLVKINGTADEVPQGCSIKDVLTARRISAEIAIVALNGEIVKRDKWEDIVLAANDDVEIIRIIGGG
jgi:thiamine biosynthesis protein ThiS